jgi:signal peptidase I
MIDKSLRKRAVSAWREWVRPFALFFLVMAPLRSAVVDWNWVPSGSMKPTIMVGDMVFVNKLAYDLKIPFTTTHLSTWANPARGDVAVLFSPKDGTRLVKRVIGLPGDTIELRSEILYVNGVRQDYSVRDRTPFMKEFAEDRSTILAVEHLGGRDHLIAVFPDRAALRTFGPYVLPKDKYFMMGDSRDNSTDSRFFGPVDRQAIVGKATTVIVSFDASHYLLPRVSRFFLSLYPTKV